MVNTDLPLESGHLLANRKGRFIMRRNVYYYPCEEVNFDLIKEYIDADDKNYYELSKTLGWGKNGVSNLLRKENNVAEDKLQQLAFYFNVPVETFLLPDMEEDDEYFESLLEMAVRKEFVIENIAEIKELLVKICDKVCE